MNKKCIKYKDCYLDPNSKCYELYHSKNFKELDKLIKKLDVDYKKLTGEIKDATAN